MKEYFKEQLSVYPVITADVLAKVEYRAVWSGKRIDVGDRVVYAFVFLQGTDDLKLINFLERELNELPQMFTFIKMDPENFMPILAFKNDTKKHT